MTVLDTTPIIRYRSPMTNIRRNPGGTPFRYGGRDFSEAEIDRIRQITDDPWCTTPRQAIARAVCTALDWTTPNGQPRDL